MSNLNERVKFREDKIFVDNELGGEKRIIVVHILLLKYHQIYYDLVETIISSSLLY